MEGRAGVINENPPASSYGHEGGQEQMFSMQKVIDLFPGIYS